MYLPSLIALFMFVMFYSNNPSQDVREIQRDNNNNTNEVSIGQYNITHIIYHI